MLKEIAQNLLAAESSKAPIEPGMFILAGALSKALAATVGEHYKASFQGVGDVEVLFK